MPILSRFYGIVIRMYFQQAEHNPPHIHALYDDDMAEINIQTGAVLEGYLPPKALAMVREWVGIHRDDLYRFGRRRNSKSFLLLSKEMIVCFIE